MSCREERLEGSYLCCRTENQCAIAFKKGVESNVDDELQCHPLWIIVAKMGSLSKGRVDVGSAEGTRKYYCSNRPCRVCRSLGREY